MENLVIIFFAFIYSSHLLLILRCAVKAQTAAQSWTWFHTFELVIVIKLLILSDCKTSQMSNLHVYVSVSHSGNGSHRLNHMANHVNDGQVDDGPVGSKQSLWSCCVKLL